MKNRGGFHAAFTCVEEALRKSGVVRPRDFQAQMNSHSWPKDDRLNLTEVAPGVWIPHGRTICATALAQTLVPLAVLGLESALWAHRLLRSEPSPVQLILPRGARASLKPAPPMEFHWSATPPDQLRSLRLDGVPTRAHTVERALVDIVRLHLPERWPRLEDLDWAVGAQLVCREELLSLASRLRALAPVSAWLSRQPLAQPAQPASCHRGAAGAPQW